MTTEISELSFEEAIANTLVTGRADGTPTNFIEDASSSYGEFIPGGYRLGKSEEYDRSLCLVPNDVYDFILATAMSSVQRWEIALERLLTRRWRPSKAIPFVW
jgi:hypothetical protein